MKECKVVEDLYPLYEENLVHDETTVFIENHLATCTSCSLKFLKQPLHIDVPVQPTKVAASVAVKKTQSKLAIIQLFIMMLSFYFAMTTNILQESFGFILTYYILGIVTFLFYRSYFLTFAIAFLPIFVMAFYDTAFANNAYNYYKTVDGGNFVQFIGTHLIGAGFLALIHTVFAMIGATIGTAIIKLRTEERV